MAVAAILSGCSTDEAPVIERELAAYFDLFAAEAAVRGMTVDYSDADLSAYIENIQENGTIGQCKSYADGAKEVVVDNGYWDNATELEKEYVVFHELGHCLLDRAHDDSRTNNGFCTSIMQSGDNSCRSMYTEANRDVLLDELFGL